MNINKEQHININKNTQYEHYSTQLTQAEDNSPKQIIKYDINNTTTTENTPLTLNIDNDTTTITTNNITDTNEAITNTPATSNDNHTNNRTNRIIEDENMTSPWGDCPSFKSDDECRLILQNVNGLSPNYNCAKATAMAHETDLMCADIIGMVETNTFWKHSNILESTSAAWKKYYDQTKIVVSSSDIHFDTAYQPGGTMMVIGSPWSTRTQTRSDISGLGRWTEAVITGRNNKKVAIITVYGVGKNKIGTCGPQTCYFQQWNILNKDTNLRIDPREKLFEDLSNTIAEYKHLNTEIIIMMDANDTLQNPNSKLTKWVKENQLYDPHLELHGCEDEPPTYARGKNRIDYILTSERMLNYVTGAGILPLHEITTSDHRALFVDIDFKAFFDGELFDILNVKGRDLSTGDPRTVVKYQQLLLDEINKSEIETKIEEINRKLQTQEVDDNIRQQFEEIDIEMTNMKLRCEKQSKQRFKHPWSPALKNAYRNLQFWNIWLSEKRLSKKKRKRFQIASNIETRKINLLQQRLKYANEENIQFAYSCNNKTINENVKIAKKKLNEVRAKANEHRIEYLKLQAETYNDQGCKDMEKAIKALMSREKKRRIFRKLRGVMGKLKSGGLDHVLKINGEGGEERISDKDRMYDEIIKRNREHFSQADGTPFTVEPLRSLIGETATNNFCDQILNGTINLDGLDIEEATKALLRNLVKNDDYEQIDQHISDDDLISGYKKWNENTSTSPSGCHLGHEKALLKRIREQEIEGEVSETPPLYKRVFQITAQKLNWAIQHGYVYERWKKVVNAMIEKIPGKPLLSKLRIIHLLESDFNLMIGILWGRRLVYLAEDKNLFDDGQSGSRPGKRCQDLLLQKDTTLAIWRMSRTDGIFFDNDAKSCFDRIVMTCASLCSQHFGMPKQPCELFLKTLYQMKYHIKTSFGISDTFYSATDTTSVHGPGQGGRGSPCIWLAISSLIMKCAKLRSDGATIINPFDDTERLNISITGFVDDVTHWLSNGSRDIIEQISDVQHMAQWWEQLLYSTGGKLELEKCFLYVMRWQFDNEGQPFITKPEELPVDVKLTDSESKTEYIINYKNCHEAHRSLGVMFTPGGSNKAEYERMVKKSHSFAQRIGISNINRSEAKTLYFSCYIPGISYSLCVDSFTFNQCQKVQGATTQMFLSRMGFNRCLPSAVVYANPKIGGIGLRHLFSEQGTEKICYILQTIRCGSKTGQLLKIRLLWAHLFAGTQKPVLEDTSTFLPHLDIVDPWIKTLREFLLSSELTITIPEFNDQRLKCENDEFIMTIAIQHMTKDEIIKVNNCRLFLRVITISDIASADGKTITTDAYWCIESAIIRGNGTWPTQERPGKKAITIWQKMIDIITEVESLKLETKLGPWTKTQSEVIRTNQSTFYDISTTQVVKYDETTRAWTKGLGRKGRIGFKLYGWIPAQTAPLLSNLVPASMEKSATTELLKWRKVEIAQETNNTVRTWRELLESKSGWEKQLLSEAEFSYVGTISAMTKHSNNVQVFVNSSVKDQFYSYSWIAFDDMKKTGSASGTPIGTKSSLHRSETYAILSWLMMTRQLIRMHQNMEINFNTIIYVTSKTVVKEMDQKYDINCMKNAMIDDYDIVNEVKILMEELKKLGCTIGIRIVKHKRKKKKDELTLIEERSIEARTIAKEATKQNEPAEHTNINVPSCKAFLVSGDKILTSDEKTTARWKWPEFMIQDYYCDKFDLTLDELHTIDWYTLKQTREKMTPTLQTFSIKYAINWLPTGSRLELQGELVTQCIHCGNYEDTYHLLQCLKRKETLPEMVERFAKELDDCKTDPRLKRTLLYHIATYLREKRLAPKSNVKAHQTAVDEQNKIGWYNFTKGIWSKRWRSIQEEYEERQGIKKNNWAIKIMNWWIQTSDWIRRVDGTKRKNTLVRNQCKR